MGIEIDFVGTLAGISGNETVERATAFVGTKMYNIGGDCIAWCNATSQVYSFNEMIVGLMIPVLAFFFFNMYHLVLMYGHKNKYLQGENAEYNKNLVLNVLHKLALWSFFIFFGWIIYQRYWGMLIP